MVSMLALYSGDLSSNPAEAYSFSVKIVIEKNKLNKKEARVGPFIKKTLTPSAAKHFTILATSTSWSATASVSSPWPERRTTRKRSWRRTGTPPVQFLAFFVFYHCPLIYLVEGDEGCFIYYKLHVICMFNSSSLWSK